MASIITNQAAIQALQTTSAISSRMAITRKRIATGLTVSGTKDDSSKYAIAQQLRGNAATWLAAGRNASRASSILDVAAAGTERISDVLNLIKSKAYELASDLDPGSRTAIQADIEGLVEQIDSVADTSEFAGVNLLKGAPSLNTVTTTSYVLPATSMALPALSSMVALPMGVTLQDASTSRKQLPTSTRTPGSFGAALAAMNGGGIASMSVAAGSTPGRVELLVDAQSIPDSIEIWQGGTRVAASGQGYAPGGAPVAAGSTVSGQNVLRFDYDPSKGQTIEIRVNPNGAQENTMWSIDAFELQDPSTPAASPTSVHQSQSTLVSSASLEQTTAADPEQVALAQDTAITGGTSQYVQHLGSQAGRVDMVFDAFGTGDTMEVWQAGRRIAATGQAYAGGGGTAGAGTAVTGSNLVSFDYDPVGGPVDFRFNPGGAASGSAWVVAAASLSPTASARPTPAVSTSTRQEQGHTPAHYDFVVTPIGEAIRVSTRSLDSAGLGLDALNWSNPASVIEAVSRAHERVAEALGYFGTNQRVFDRQGSFSSRMIDVLDEGIGNLVDADLGKEAANLQADTVRQALAVKALSIANSQPGWMLSLFQ